MAAVVGKHRVAVAAIALGVVLSAPLLLGARYDSFPLSTYPMFAGDREQVASVSTVVAVTGTERARLSSQLIGGTDEPMLAAESVVDSIRADTTAALCTEVASRAADKYAGSTLEVVTERYDTLAWFDGDREPVERTVWASCNV